MNRRWWLAGLLILSALAVRAQDYDDDSADDDPTSGAMLWLRFNRQGALDATFSLPQKATISDVLPDLAAQALHCPLGAMKHPDPWNHAVPEKWSAARRERYRQQIAETNQRQFEAHCGAALARQDQLFEADFDFSPMTAELRRMGADQLAVYVDIPKARYRDYSKSNLAPFPTIGTSDTDRIVVYQFALAESAPRAVFHIAYGFRRRDLYRALAILAAFILVPVLLTLWMRRRALSSAKIDPASAWFGFFRTLNWMITGSALIWVSSGLGVREMLQDWVLHGELANFRTALADVTIAVVPWFLVYFLCVALSYPVHEQLRGRQWTRGEFLWRQWITIGAQVFPLMMFIAGIELVAKQPEVAAVLLIVTVAAFQLFQNLKLRLLQQFPQPLTTGDLRDRVFQLAQPLGVAVNQIFVLPAGKGQIANAYAARNQIVMFTDHLLEHLNKREVDGVAAHELAHLRYRHPAKIGVALFAAVLLPRYFSWLASTVMGLLALPLTMLTFSDRMLGVNITVHLWKALTAFEHWSQSDLFLLALGMTAFYFLSRHFEYVADATAVRLTGDAEAQITGLLKVNRLNLIPIRWGKASESWLTHPATVRRAERMAAAGGLAPERLQQILSDYESQQGAVPPVPAEERYAVPPVGNTERLRAAVRDRSRTQAKLWINLAAYVVPPAVFSLLLQKLHLDVWPAVGAYWAGISVTAVFVTFVAVWLGESGKAGEKRRLAQRFAREGVPAGLDGDLAVGFAPGPHPRLFGTKYYWDAGFLILASDRLQFVGEQVKFSFTRAEIEGVAIGFGGPSWWKIRRVYVRWKTTDGHNGIFSLSSCDPAPVWQSRARAREIGRRIEEWYSQAAPFPAARPGLVGLKRLEVGQVTSVSPNQLGKFRVMMRVFLWLLPLSVGISMLTHASMQYVLFSVFVVRIVQSIPYWRYRDVLPPFPQTQNTASGAAAGAR
jgi:Zn-dependent protease with chaperone function